MYKSLLFTFLIFVASLSGATLDTRSIEKMEQELISLINEERQKEGLAPLEAWHPLTLIARTHSQNMAEKSVEFGHDGFEDRFEDIQDHAYCRRFAENVAFSYNVKDHLKTAVRGWMRSEGHRENILDNFELTGIGIAINKKGEFYVTQLFAICSE